MARFREPHGITQISLGQLGRLTRIRDRLRLKGSLTPVLAWIEANLHEELTVEAMARHAHLSPRTFARRLGTTPADYRRAFANRNSAG